MPIVARASRGYAVRILIMAGLCAVFAFWFAYDGVIGWPKRDDTLVQYMVDHPNPHIDSPQAVTILHEWPGFKKATSDQIKEMGDLAKSSGIDEWKTELDLFWQRAIVVGLVLGTAGTLYFYRRYTRKRAVADDAGLSPAHGIMIPWANITKIDNTQWDKRGIVTISYTDAAGQGQSAILDDYDLDNLPVLLEEVAERAINATFDPPLETGGAPAKAE
jgi:hypothetical protein